MQNEIIFVDGLKIDNPSENAPDFVVGKVSIHANRLTKFIAEHRNENGFVNIDLLKSKKGGMYFKLNTFKKEANQPQDAPQATESAGTIDYPSEDISESDIPF